MKPIALTISSLAAAFAAFFYSSTAYALGPVDLEIAARVGAATAPSSDFSSSPLGFGMGGRAGVSFFGIYGGVSGMYYFGSTNSGNGDGSVHLHAAMEGFEAGYTLPLPFKIRPKVGVGNVTFVQSQDGQSTFSNLYLEPGVLVFLPIRFISGGAHVNLFVGADVNALIFPGMTGESISGGSKTYTSLSVHGQVGVRF